MHFGSWKVRRELVITRELSRAETLVSIGRKWPQSIQREPSSRHSRGGRSQTWPRAAS